jgi:hypothetical protein
MLKTQSIEKALKFGSLGAPLTYVAFTHGPNVEEVVRKEEESNDRSY